MDLITQLDAEHEHPRTGIGAHVDAAQGRTGPLARNVGVETVVLGPEPEVLARDGQRDVAQQAGFLPQVERIGDRGVLQTQVRTVFDDA